MAEITIRKSFRNESRKDYGSQYPPDQGLSGEDLNLGCQMRIADALEQVLPALKSINLETSLGNRSLREIAEMPKKTRTEIARLKRIIKQQKAEIAALKGVS